LALFLDIVPKKNCEVWDVRKKVNNFSEKGQACHGLGVKSLLHQFFPIKILFATISILTFSDGLSTSFMSSIALSVDMRHELGQATP
jgi:hypothetical protein